MKIDIYDPRLIRAITLIAAERSRQISQEGWSTDHDDNHDEAEMIRAAVIYMQHAVNPDMITIGRNGAPLGWPWAPSWWKPKSRQRDLVRAGALCIAELERRHRKNPADHNNHVMHKLQLIAHHLIDGME